MGQHLLCTCTVDPHWKYLSTVYTCSVAVHLHVYALVEHLFFYREGSKSLLRWPVSLVVCIYEGWDEVGCRSHCPCGHGGCGCEGMLQYAMSSPLEEMVAQAIRKLCVTSPFFTLRI